MAVASLVLGIISLVVAVVAQGFNWLACICGVIGIIFGALGMKKTPDKKGMAIAGLVMSIIGLILGLILFLACAACVGAAGNALSSATSALK